MSWKQKTTQTIYLEFTGILLQNSSLIRVYRWIVSKKYTDFLACFNFLALSILDTIQVPVLCEKQIYKKSFMNIVCQ